MTSALVPFTFNDTKLFTVTVDGKHWTRAKEICKSLKYEKKTGNVIRDHVSNENITQKCQLIGLTDTSVKWRFYINEEGVHELVLKSTMSNATDFAKVFGINVHDHKYLSKERETLSYILTI